MDTKYFDYNATTPLRTEAKEALLKALDSHWLNPSSPYRAAASVHAHLQAAREKIADLFGVHPERVVFNSGATEGNNAVFANWRTTLPKDALVAISPTENIERGELHTLLNLRADGVFSLKRITLGIYLDDNPEDTSAFRDDLGNYRIDGDSIHVNLHTRIIWDSFYGDDLEPDSTENLYGNLSRDRMDQLSRSHAGNFATPRAKRPRFSRKSSPRRSEPRGE